jgi:hypothetical protein
MIIKIIGVALFTDFARLRWDPHFQPPCREAFSLVRFTPHSDRPQAPATHHTHSPALAARWRIGRTSRQSFWCNIAGTRYVCLGPRVWREGEWPWRCSVLLREVFGVAFVFWFSSSDFSAVYVCKCGGSRRRFQQECLCVWIAEGESVRYVSSFLAE